MRPPRLSGSVSQKPMTASARVRKSTTEDPVWVGSICQSGYAVVAGVFSSAECDAMLTFLTPVSSRVQVGRRGGARNLLASVPEVSQLARSPQLRALVEPILGSKCFAIGATLFDKTPMANWRVPWHQDLTIAVQGQRDVPGWGRWSKKSGVQCVQPSVAILEHMLAVRVHLDPCEVSDGCLRAIPGSHRLGRLTDPAIQSLRQNREGLPCPVPRGGVLLMRPLLLHGSSPALGPNHRRVIHIEYACTDLPSGIAWHQRVYAAPGSG
jgi:hypothetical protein